jgi:hypothetical protein
MPPRSHRGAAASNLPARYLVALAVITAVVLVLVIVGVVGWLRPHDDNTATTGALTSTSHPSTSRSPSTHPSSTASGKPSSSKSASGKPSAKPSTKPSAKPSSKPSTKPSSTPSTSPTHSSPPPPQVPRDYPVVVLNETPITRLAARVATRLRQDGWQVTGVGNWMGAIHETTVYYPAGERSRAQRLAADLGVSRIRPRVGGMLPNRLSVVLHDPPDYN